ncbi:molecular chaperone, partial [Salmonella enterica subsp. enterica serovar Schwarzengrund]|nr:molecular chaperone [Salmonella enterica subsp. enterica serovar Schwarzengrund]EHR2155230.1 molecular chaperone [Salmonella enterica]ECV1920234.1 molecular chaperone [Salmonella enterica subsp. enterica serovar Schwarzengrund]ECX2408780.1 molecular chaperone [Salmonella enterica subsp. enterica serovar Schwarzengrund]EDE2968994.1 fimbria/pilus periplasmic chaperone [Salmonella enterica subsp. enterica serovar Schwarzengrund]
TLLCFCHAAQCAIQKANTPYPETNRVIIRGTENATGSFTVTNPGERAWLVQSWVEDENGMKYNSIYPNLFRIDGFQSQVLKISTKKEQWSAEHEKMLWLYIKIIPPLDASKKNKLEIPIIYKLKVFLRPPHLETRRESFVCKRINEEAVKIMNFSSFIITLTRVTDDKERIKLKKTEILKPNDGLIITKAHNTSKFKLYSIDDQGTEVESDIICI